jgi:hypothetical protein
MGLVERRAAKEFETKRFPQLKQEIDEAACFDVPLEVKWDTLATDGDTHLYEANWVKVYFQPLVQALKGITFDDMGKDAVKAGLKKIEIQNHKGASSGDAMVSFENGILVLDHKPHVNVDNVNERARSIQKLLEAKL